VKRDLFCHFLSECRGVLRFFLFEKSHTMFSFR
jgi:hypothetical protein